MTMTSRSAPTAGTWPSPWAVAAWDPRSTWCRRTPTAWPTSTSRTWRRVSSGSSARARRASTPTVGPYPSPPTAGTSLTSRGSAWTAPVGGSTCATWWRGAWRPSSAPNRTSSWGLRRSRRTAGSSSTSYPGTWTTRPTEASTYTTSILVMPSRSALPSSPTRPRPSG